MLTSNLPFDEWTSVFGSERLTGALLDRLTHHVHILEMNGDSYRLAPFYSATLVSNSPPFTWLTLYLSRDRMSRHSRTKHNL